jgi:predicted nucleic acid-binding protein
MLIALDSDCIIYYVEHDPVWAPKVEARLMAGIAAGNDFAASHLSRTECLVGPFKSGNTAVLADFVSFFTSPSLTLLHLTPDVCEQAARLRAQFNFKLPDALNLAAAMVHGCGRYLTNDARLTRCTSITVEVLA